MMSGSLAAGPLQVEAKESVRAFAYQVQPLLSDKCFHCHGPDESQRPTDLRLDTEAGIREAFADGDLAESEAWRRILSDDPDEQMPPPEMHKPFTAEERQLVRRWVEAGADWSPHWAFVAPVKVAPPSEHANHPVDAFVRRRLVEEGLTPVPRATRDKLIRRATLDLHGLTPSLAEIDAFVEDPNPGALERVIDRLLASPRYGERMAVSWLDAARYADTNGYQNDFKRTMWPWRDWVINAFNQNMPFDRFTIEQLAGDLLPDPSHEQRLATAFNRNHRTVTEAGSIPEEWLVENVVDRVETTSAVFLGLTMGCARCHDHKYDPVSQEEFFEFFAFFHNVNEQGVYTETRGNAGPMVECPTAEEALALDRQNERVAKLTDRLGRQGKGAARAAAGWYASTTPPASLAPSVAVRLDSDVFAAVADGERVVMRTGTGKTPSVEDAWLGTVARFGGSHWLEYDDLIEPERDKPLTITAWVKRTGDGAVLSKMHNAAAHRGVDWLFHQDGRLMVHMIHRWPESALKVTTKESLPAGKWTPITVTYDGSSRAAGVAIYFGLAEQSLHIDNDNLAGSIHTEQPFRVGRRSASSSFRGSIGRLRVFDRVLSRDEIQSQIERDLLTAPPQRERRDLQVALRTQPGRNRGNDTPEPLRGERLRVYAMISTDPGIQQYAKAVAELDAAQADRQRLQDQVTTCMVMEELPEPRATYVLNRGEYDKPDKDRPVTADVPDFLGALPTERNDRLALAEWIVSRDNPLTARVVVNRLWSRLFGGGLVKSEENFGVQCDPPSHPDLLDWLAVEFIESGWDLQHMTRLIMTSETYQQASAAPPQRYADDPENRLLARGPRRRLEAEFIRDNALQAAGLLDPRIGGPSVRPYQPEGLWEELAGGASQGPYVRSEGQDLYRRSLYTYRKRTVPHPTLAVFDAPSFEMCTVKRSVTNTPLQALALLNDATYVEAARKLGERMLAEGGSSDAERAEFGFRLVTSRTPTAAERAVLVGVIHKNRQRYEADPESAGQLLSVGEAGSDTGSPRSELAAYTAVGSLLLNLDEAVTIE